MVRDGIQYAAGLGAAGALVWWLAGPGFAAPLFLLAAFCLYFFRDPERVTPDGPVAVSPADGKVVAIRRMEDGRQRVSIFLNIFDVHVNRTPIPGMVTKVEYRPGRFLVASKEAASQQNEQNAITVEGDGTSVEFRQIAGLIARRVVCSKKPGDRVAAGERVGVIKFGSRVDVLFGGEWTVETAEGRRVRCGSSVIARRNDAAGRV